LFEGCEEGRHGSAVADWEADFWVVFHVEIDEMNEKVTMREDGKISCSTTFVDMYFRNQRREESLGESYRRLIV
jgi:hypothetical protein